MTYRSLGFVDPAQAAPTNPPTPLSEVYFEPGFKYLYVNEARQVRPEYAIVVASASVPGFGWTDEQMATGTVNISQQVLFGRYNLSSTSPPWPMNGVILYGASYIGSPDGFFTNVPPEELGKWANQPGLWVVRFPGNLPFTKATWDKILRRIDGQPFKCPDGLIHDGNGVCIPPPAPPITGGEKTPVTSQPPPVVPAQSGVNVPWVFYAAGGLLAVSALLIYTSAIKQPRRRKSYEGADVQFSRNPAYLPMMWIKTGGDKWDRKWA